ncbi:bromodomain adjacent to zinc finger domain protein 2B-like [Pleuronectes platessa]|uniref:bromodomain adjacent to zinc finger domain protein 2B-like n=1 Tax=Pleuronectes platessa TaxID=8262 RepID=UPI00232A7A08|nr:bromodomain adjacent to zinc finger domain protein 2B-like [Pleuronectes platessa]
MSSSHSGSMSDHSRDADAMEEDERLTKNTLDGRIQSSPHPAGRRQTVKITLCLEKTRTAEEDGQKPSPKPFSFSSSPEPLPLWSPQKPLSRALAPQKPSHEQRGQMPSSEHTQPVHNPKESSGNPEEISLHRNRSTSRKRVHSEVSLKQPVSQQLSSQNGNDTNLLLNPCPNGALDSEVQDAPLDLIKRRRMQSSTLNNKRHGRGSRKTKRPKSLHAGRSLLKTTSSDFHSSKDSDSDSLGDGGKDEDDADDLEEEDSESQSEGDLVIDMSPSVGSDDDMTERAESELTPLPGSGKRSRLTVDRVLKLPLEYGWQRETRIRSVAGQLKVEVAYIAPCGKKLHRYPNVTKYLVENGISKISRDNFSFSPKIKVGAFYEARQGPEGRQWFLLAEEEITPIISAMDDKLRRQLEDQEMAGLLAEIKLMKKMEMQAKARAAKEARRQEAVRLAEQKRIKREHMKLLEQEKMIKRMQQLRMEKERRAQQLLEAKRQKQEEAAKARKLAAEKRIKKKERLKQEKTNEERLNKERELQLRQVELEKANAPNEDMCLADLKCLPELSRVPGLVLEGSTLFHCLKVLQFLHTFGKALGLANLNDLDLSVLQEGLINTGGSMVKVQDLLVSMVSSAIQFPGIPAGHRSKTLLGEDLSNVAINRDNVSEILQIYMEAHSYQTEFAPLALSLRTRAFQDHSPSQKVSMLTFLVNGLTWSNAVHSENDKNMEHMTGLWKDKWAVEDQLRELWSLHNKRTEQRDSSVGGDDSKDQAYEEEEEDSRAEIREEEDNNVNSASVEELEKQIDKLCMQHNQITKKLLHSQSQPSLMIGQDRYMRRYWLLPGCGGVFVEGIMSSEGYEELKETQETSSPQPVLQDDQLTKTLTNNTVNTLETPEALCDFPRPQPIPKEMLRGWWRVSDVQELHSLVEALHSRGFRENALRNQIQINMEYLTLLYSNSEDAFDVAKLDKVREKTVESWCVEEQAMEVDMSQQQPVEALERRDVSGGPQIKQSAQFLRSTGLQNQKAGGRKRRRAKLDSHGSCAKRAKLAKEDKVWQEMCRVLLAELEAHEDAGPFLKPVNLKTYPWYKRIIKKPMDFSTIRKKITNNKYQNSETFNMDVHLVFDNCEKCNEDDSQIGRAGRTMKEFFDKRWAEQLRKEQS